MDEELAPLMSRLASLETTMSSLAAVSLLPANMLILPVLADITLHPNQSPPGAGRTDVIEKKRKDGCFVTVTVETTYAKVSETREPSKKGENGETIPGKLIHTVWKVTVKVTIKDACVSKPATIETVSFETHLKLKPTEFDVPKPKTMKKSKGTEIDILEYPNGVKVKVTKTPYDPAKPADGKVKVDVEMEDVGSDSFEFG